MVIVKSPLRISLAGGGTDLPSWYRTHGSMFISVAIDKYIYTTLHESKYNPNIRLRYSEMEEVNTIDEIKHEIFRETLRDRITGGLEITSHAEIPSGTGLGSSGAFGVGVLHALNPKIGKEALALGASRIQMDILKYPIGLQDQYVSAYGGCKMYQIDSDGDVSVTDFLDESIRNSLQDRLVMFYTGIKRDTNKILSGSTNQDLDKIQKLAWETKDLLGSGNLDGYGRLLNEHWKFKKNRGQMTNSEIDKWYQLGLENGALGGKLIGAGGGGFLLFYVSTEKDKQNLINNMSLTYQSFGFDMEGSKVIYENIY